MDNMLGRIAFDFRDASKLNAGGLNRSAVETHQAVWSQPRSVTNSTRLPNYAAVIPPIRSGTPSPNITLATLLNVNGLMPCSASLVSRGRIYGRPAVKGDRLANLLAFSGVKARFGKRLVSDNPINRSYGQEEQNRHGHLHRHHFRKNPDA